MKNTLMTEADWRYQTGTGPAPHSWIPRDPGVTITAARETTICGNCGAPIWADARGARHACRKPRKAV